MGNEQGKGNKEKDSAKGIDNSRSQPTGSSANPTEMKLIHAFDKYVQRSNSSPDKILLRSDLENTVFPELPEIGGMLFDYCVSAPGRNVTSKEGINRDRYVSSLSHLMSAITDSQQLEIYFILSCQTTPDKLCHEDAVKLLNVCRKASTLGVGSALDFSEADVDAICTALCKSLLKSDSGSVDQSEFTTWCCKNSPRLCKDLHNYVTQRLIGYENSSKASNPDIANAGKADPADILSYCRTGLNSSILWLCSNLVPMSYIPTSESLGACSQACESSLAQTVYQNGWHILYSSTLHGLSVNRFQHHVIGYTGATLLIISFNKLLFVVALDQPWKDLMVTKQDSSNFTVAVLPLPGATLESRSRWGGSDCLFFQILPEFRICQSGEGLMYYNASDRTVPKGIHIGRDSRTTFLKLDEELIHANHYGVDYKLESVEVWGCGGGSKLEAFRKQRQWERNEVVKQQNRKLVPEDWKESVDRHLLELGGVTTDHAQRGDI